MLQCFACRVRKPFDQFHVLYEDRYMPKCDECRTANIISRAGDYSTCGLLKYGDILSGHIVYVLKLKAGKFYVGITADYGNMLRKHMSCIATEWTSIYKLVRVEETVIYDPSLRLEDEVTLKYMRKYGVSNVRGGQWIRPKLSRKCLSIINRKLQLPECLDVPMPVNYPGYNDPCTLKQCICCDVVKPHSEFYKVMGGPLDKCRWCCNVSDTETANMANNNRFVREKHISTGYDMIYVLELTNGKYYVGITCHLNSRILQHALCDGNHRGGSIWTNKYRIIRVIDVIFKDVTLTMEDDITVRVMHKYGIANVRGGIWCSLVLSTVQSSNIRRRIAELRPMPDNSVKCSYFGENVSRIGGFGRKK